MSVTTRSPLRMAGAIVNSGAPNTGEVRHTRGGEQTHWASSGVAVDTLIFSGGGRLHTAVRLNALPTVSGGGVIFYDGHIATSGGPFAASGHRALGIIPGIPIVVSGTVANGQFGVPLCLDMPFLSGLIAAPLGGSGGPAFTVSYSQAVDPAIG